MYMSAMKGKCLNLLHVYQDNLWAHGDKSVQLPIIPSTFPNRAENDSSSDEEEKIQVNEDTLKKETEMMEELKLKEDAGKRAESCQEEEDGEDEEKAKLDHEKILTESFISACKFKSKEIKLPIIVSTFMKIMQTCW